MDIATLGIKIENGEVVKATASLNSMEVAGAKAEITASRLSRRMALAEIEARKMDAAMKQSVFSVGGLAHVMGLSETAAEELAHAAGKVGAALGAVAVIEFIGHKTIEETIAAQNAMAQLEAAVKSTGGVAGRSAEQLDEMSRVLQRQTTFSDEAVKSAQAMLLTFDKIRGTEFDRATAAVTDLAARMGGDLQGAAIQVGKALQDPTTGLTALRRSGVSFSESQIDVIKQLYETGQVAEGQRVILKELEHQFGGSAAAARDTLGGALAGLKNAFGDLFEVTKSGSQSTVDVLNAITHSLETSGISMNSFITNTVVGWNNIVATIQKAKNVMGVDLSHGLAAYSAEVARLNAIVEQGRLAANARATSTAKVGPAGGITPAGGDPGSEAARKAQAQHEENEAMVREAQQEVEIASMVGKAQERAQALARIGYEETNKAIKAQRELKGALLDETLAAIHTEADLKRQAVNINADAKYAKDLQEIWNKGVSDVISATSNGIAAMLSSVGKLFHDMLARMQQEGQSNLRLEAGLAAISGGMAGYNTGQSLYSTSHGTASNYARGALGGAASGAMAGAALGSVVPLLGTAVGAAIGGLAGLAGGMLGAGSAAKEAEKEMRDLRRALADSIATITAQLKGDTLGAALEQSHQQFEALRRQADAAYAGGKNEGDRARAYAQINALEDERVRQLKEEAALVKQRFAEDLQVRLLAAQGHTKEAESLRLQLAQQREYQQAIKDGADPATLALLAQVQAQEKLAAATNQANSAALNMVEGYKIQAAIFGASLGRAPSAGSSSYGAPSSASRTSSTSGDLTVNVVMPDGSVLGKAVLKDFKGRAAAQYGDATRWSDVQ
jgi:hypothetical protein